MRVAFTSSDGKRVDEHFGQATHFHVWEVGADSAEFVELVGAFGGAGRTHGHRTEHVVGLGAAAEEAGRRRQASPADGARAEPEQSDAGRRGEGAARAIDDEEDRIAARASAVEGCTLVYTEAIGGPAAAKLVARRIHPMKTGAEAVPIAEVVEKLQRVLRGRPAPWLRKALGLAPEAAPVTEEEDV